MRRAGNLWERVLAFDNLLAAARRAAAGKRRRESTAAFLDRAELLVLEIQRELEAGTWRPRPMRTFGRQAAGSGPGPRGPLGEPGDERKRAVQHRGGRRPPSTN